MHALHSPPEVAQRLLTAVSHSCYTAALKAGIMRMSKFQEAMHMIIFAF